MHASFDELLKQRDDRPGDAALVAHVRSCAECGEQLAQLQSRIDLLRRLPGHGPAPDRWSEIQAALAAPPMAASPAKPRPSWWVPAASAAAVVIAVLVTLQPHGSTSPGPEGGIDQPTAAATGTSVVPAASSADQAGLIEESQRLEHLLAAFSEAPRVTRAGTALTVADLEDRIQWVDYRLNLGAEAGLDPNQARRLWRERVDLLNSLVAVRYAESRTMAF